MGAIWLLNVLAWLVEGGVRASGYPGWQMRSRSSGGFDWIAGIIIHHDAGATWLSEQRRVELEYRDLEFAPVGNMHIHRDGTVTVGAAGAANTAGKGGPLTGSKGTIPVDFANRVTINIEASNNGIDEDWPQAQLDTYILVIAILCIRLGLNPLRDVWDHREWTTRKIDVGGGRCVFAVNGSGKWDMNRVRAAVAAKVTELTAPTNPARITIEDEMSATYNTYPEPVYDSREDGNRRPVPNGETLVVPLGLANIASVNITAVAAGKGWLQVAGGPLPTDITGFALLNFDDDRLTSNTWTGACPTGELHIRPVGTDAHVLVEVMMRGNGEAA